MSFYFANTRVKISNTFSSANNNIIRVKHTFHVGTLCSCIIINYFNLYNKPPFWVTVSNFSMCAGFPVNIREMSICQIYCSSWYDCMQNKLNFKRVIRTYENIFFYLLKKKRRHSEQNRILKWKTFKKYRNICGIFLNIKYTLNALYCYLATIKKKL